MYIYYILYTHIYIYIYLLFILYICDTPQFLGGLKKLPPPALCKRGGSKYIKMLVIKPKSYIKPLTLHIFEQQVTIEVLSLKAIFIIRILDLANFL